MGIIILVLLLILLATGALWVVLKVALGVALGLLLGFALIGGFVWWRVRRALKPVRGWRQVGKGSRSGSSEVTVHYREPED